MNKVINAYRRHLSVGRARLAELTGGVLEVASEGSKVWDSAGNEYLDCGGYGVFLLGHRHPDVVRAVVDQIHRHPMATRLLLDPMAAEAAQVLAEVTPDGLHHVHFVNSGAEATEAAIKLARAHGKRTLVSTLNGYHGKTTGALALTASELYQAPFRPLLPQVRHVPFGDARALAEVLATTPDCCVVVEPVQGEGGVVLPPPGYLSDVRRLCSEHGALFVLDEIQTGLGRLGTWWGADRDGVVPDVLLVGKILSGGVVPVAAMVSTEEIYAPFSRDPFLHSSTFAGSPIAMAAAKSAVLAICDHDLVARSASLGEEILAGLRAIARSPVVDVRGAGLLIGVELADGRLAGELVLAMLEHGVLVNHSLNAPNVVRLTPPAVLSSSDVDRLLQAFEHALTRTLERTS